MGDEEIEMWSTLILWFVGGWFVGSTVCWWIVLKLFEILDDYLQG